MCFLERVDPSIVNILIICRNVLLPSHMLNWTNACFSKENNPIIKRAERLLSFRTKIRYFQRAIEEFAPFHFNRPLLSCQGRISFQELQPTIKGVEVCLWLWVDKLILIGVLVGAIDEALSEEYSDVLGRRVDE